MLNTMDKYVRNQCNDRVIFVLMNFLAITSPTNLCWVQNNKGSYDKQFYLNLGTRKLPDGNIFSTFLAEKGINRSHDQFKCYIIWKFWVEFLQKEKLFIGFVFDRKSDIASFSQTNNGTDKRIQVLVFIFLKYYTHSKTNNNIT